MQFELSHIEWPSRKINGSRYPPDLSVILEPLFPLLNLGHSPNGSFSSWWPLLCCHHDNTLVCSCLHRRPIGFPLVITSTELLPNTKIVSIACFACLLHCEWYKEEVSSSKCLISLACVSDSRSWSFQYTGWQTAGSSARKSASLYFRLTLDNLAFGGKLQSTLVSLAALQLLFL